MEISIGSSKSISEKKPQSIIHKNVWNSSIFLFFLLLNTATVYFILPLTKIHQDRRIHHHLKFSSNLTAFFAEKTKKSLQSQEILALEIQKSGLQVFYGGSVFHWDESGIPKTTRNLIHEMSKILKAPSHLHFVKYRNESKPGYIAQAGGILPYFGISKENQNIDDFSIIEMDALSIETGKGLLPPKNRPAVFLDSLYERVSPAFDGKSEWCNALFAYDLYPEQSNAFEFFPHDQRRIDGINEWANKIIATASKTKEQINEFYPHVKSEVVLSTRTRVSPIYKPLNWDQIFTQEFDFIRSLEEKEEKSKEYLIKKYNPKNYSRNKQKIFEKPFFLVVGSRSIHKNVDVFFYAISALENELKNNFDVIAVQGGEISDMHLNIVSPVGVHWFEHIDEQDLPLIYSLATSTVYLAEFKGFGMPVVESLACGTAVICGEDWDDLPQNPMIAMKVSRFNVFKIRDAMRAMLDLQLSGKLKTRENIYNRVKSVAHYGAVISPEHGWREMALEILIFLLDSKKSRGKQCYFSEFLH